MAIIITKPTVGGSEDTWGTTINTALDTIVGAANGTSGTLSPNLSALTINGTDVTATAAELNTLDGVTATTAELNILDGVTATAAELNALDGITATTAELNVMDGVTATTAELNYVDGVTSSIQTQLNAKYVAATQPKATWEAGTSTTESLVSPAKVKAAVESFATDPALFGVNQTWQDVRSSRGFNTAYQAPADKAIMWVVSTDALSDGGDIQVSTDNVTWLTLRANPINGVISYASYVIPAGNYYRFVSTRSNTLITTWHELR